MQRGGNRNDGSQTVWVVFSGQTDLSFLKWLKPGFRHCYALIKQGGRWVCVDPMAHHTDVQVYELPEEFDLPQWLRERGMLVIKAPVRRGQGKIAPLMPFTCVEAVKRLLGIHNWLIWTPWQLFEHLEKRKLLLDA